MSAADDFYWIATPDTEHVALILAGDPRPVCEEYDKGIASYRKAGMWGEIVPAEHMDAFVQMHELSLLWEDDHYAIYRSAQEWVDGTEVLFIYHKPVSQPDSLTN